MAFGLFRKRQPEPAAPAIENAPAPVAPADVPAATDSDSAREILELLDLELGAMIRQLEKAANSVAGGAEATATTLSTIRQRTDALTGRTNAAQSTATTFSQAADKFTKKIEALQRDAAGSVDAVHRISQAIEAIRPVFETVNGAVAEQNQTTSEMSENAASASSFIASVGDSAVEIDNATKEAETHGESVAKAGQAVTMS